MTKNACSRKFNQTVTARPDPIFETNSHHDAQGTRQTTYLEHVVGDVVDFVDVQQRKPAAEDVQREQAPEHEERPVPAMPLMSYAVWRSPRQPPPPPRGARSTWRRRPVWRYHRRRLTPTDELAGAVVYGTGRVRSGESERGGAGSTLPRLISCRRR